MGFPVRFKRSMAVLLCLLLSGGVLASAKKEEGEGEKAAQSEYIPVTPSLVANYGAPGTIHYLKADVSLRVTGGAAAQAKVLHHMPYVRHVLVMLLSDQTEDSLATMEAKEKLRGDALAAVQQIMQEQEGKPLVDDLLFSSFIVQR